MKWYLVLQKNTNFQSKHNIFKKLISASMDMNGMEYEYENADNTISKVSYPNWILYTIKCQYLTRSVTKIQNKKLGCKILKTVIFEQSAKFLPIAMNTCLANFQIFQRLRCQKMITFRFCPPPPLVAHSPKIESQRCVTQINIAYLQMTVLIKISHQKPKAKIWRLGFGDKDISKMCHSYRT